MTEVQILPNDRIHFTEDKAWTLNKSKTYIQTTEFKPRGLWYSMGNSWRDWIESEMPDWNPSYDFAYKLEVDTTDILILKTEEDVHTLSRDYGRRIINGNPTSIDWVEIAGSWKGIEFPEYLYSVRYDYLWYSTVDVAGGCIWDMSAIKSATPLK